MSAFTESDFATVLAANGDRDGGKRFGVLEVPPVEMATFILRLLGAIRLNGVGELQTLLNPPEGADEIDAVLRVLAGCDAMATRALMVDALKYVHIAPDPQHPGMFRALRDDDIKDLKTLGDVLGAFVRANVTSGL